MNLKKFMGKLWAHGNNNGFGNKPIKKISMNKQEAIAFHVCYMCEFIDTTCPFVNEIYTEIDKDL